MIKSFLILLVLFFAVESQETYGNLTDSQLIVVRNLIVVAENKYLPTSNYTEMAMFISKFLAQSFAGGYYWNTYIYQPTATEATLASHPFKEQFYIYINKPSSGLSYIIWSGVSRGNMGFLECVNPMKQEFGSGLNSTTVNKIAAIIQQAPIYKGSDMKQNGEYIRDKLSAETWSIIITDPSLRFGAYTYLSKNNEYAILGKYGVFKWSYMMFRVK